MTLVAYVRILNCLDRARGDTHSYPESKWSIVRRNTGPIKDIRTKKKKKSFINKYHLEIETSVQSHTTIT